MSQLTTTQAAKRCGVCARTLLRSLTRGELPGTRTPGGHWRVDESALSSWLKPRPEVKHRSSDELRLAIIEDDAKQSEALARLVALLAPGARVECAPDGFSAGLLLGAFLPHIAFVDIEMPSLDGIEVIKRSMETASLRDIHFVVVSGRLTPDRVRVLDGLGVRDIVRKPISPDTVRRVLRGRASAAPRHGARR